MYVARLNEEHDAEKIRTVIRTFAFATVVSVGPDGPVATHVPLHYHPDGHGQEWLYGHLAKGNAQWKTFQPDRDVLAIFQGPHHYISPSWYDHMNVPTWNYVAVHVYGRAELVSDYDEIRGMFETMIDHHEKALGSPYSMDSMSKEFYDKELRGIRAFKIRIDRIEANFKLSQNRHDTDHRHIQERLKEIGSCEARDVADMMKENRSNHRERT